MATRRPFAAIVILFLMGSTLGCGEEPPPPPPPKFDFTIEVQVTDENETPLPKVPVTIDGNVVGFTDAEGKFNGVLRENEGTQVTVGAQPIPGYRLLADPPSVTEMLKVTTVNEQQSGVPIFLRLEAESLKKDYFVWVKADCTKGLEPEDCDSLDVRVDGEPVAQTNRHGYAHFSFTEVPQNDMEITIATPPGAKHSPKNPTYAMTLDLDSHVYLVEETFQDPDHKETKRRRRPRRRRAKPAKQKVEKKAAEKPDDGVIDLW